VAVTVVVAIPGWREFKLEHVLLDVNGTLTNRGELVPGIRARIATLRETLTVHLVSADTFGTLDGIAAGLGVDAVRARTGADKLLELDRLDRDRCAVIGNGANDAQVLEAAALGLVVIGPEGASSAALRAADVICQSAADAIDLLLDPQALSATLRP
jgi:soluble P-type ATPase